MNEIEIEIAKKLQEEINNEIDQIIGNYIFDNLYYSKIKIEENDIKKSILLSILKKGK